MSFLSGLQKFYEIASKGNLSTNEPECEERIDNYLLYEYSLIPSIIICCLFGASITRRQMFLSRYGGRPGLIYPMDTLTRVQSISYACAFGATGFVVYRILAEAQFAIQYSGPLSITSLIAVVSMFIYGIVYFPVFASLALGTAMSYGLGAAYIWMFFIIDIYRLTECHMSAKYRLIAVVRDIPNIACLAYLSVSLPIRCAVAVRHKKYFSSSIDKINKETVKDIQESYQGIHVRDLFRKPVIKPLPVGTAAVVKNKIKHLIHRFVYHRKKGFKYPSLLVSVMFVAGCVIYMVTVEFYVILVNYLDIILDALKRELDRIGWGSQAGESVSITFTRDISTLAYHVTYAIKVSSILSITISAVVSLLSILHMMTSFRKNLFDLYRGDFKNIPPASESSAPSLCVGSMKFAGFQVAYIFWGYIIVFLVLLIVCLVLAAVIGLLIIGVSDWLVEKVLQIWPGFLIGLAMYIVQMIVAKVFFLQGSGKHLRLNNRRAYFVFVYFMFFFNIFVGLVSCLLRILKAIGIGVLCLARLDKSTLPRSFEFFDPGFSAYNGFIHMEAAHTHPVVNVFIRLLVSMKMNKKGKTNGVHVNNAEHFSPKQRLPRSYDTPSIKRKRRVKDAARSNWLVTYTLLHNPAIRVYRKGYIQALRKARAEGIQIPISDKPFTDFDLVKSREQKDKERLEELERIKSLKPNATYERDCTELSLDSVGAVALEDDITISITSV
ncbi:hypothetical protein BsWGS_09197 [Bradybaena similaris]